MDSAVQFIIDILFVAACDESFQPLQENDDTPFSLYSNLDASADTQWVRVTLVRVQLDQPQKHFK